MRTKQQIARDPKEPALRAGDAVILRDRVVNGRRLVDEIYEVMGAALFLRLAGGGSLGRCRRQARRIVGRTRGRIVERRG